MPSEYGRSKGVRSFRFRGVKGVNSSPLPPAAKKVSEVYLNKYIVRIGSGRDQAFCAETIKCYASLCIETALKKNIIYILYVLIIIFTSRVTWLPGNPSGNPSRSTHCDSIDRSATYST